MQMSPPDLTHRLPVVVCVPAEHLHDALHCQPDAGRAASERGLLPRVFCPSEAVRRKR
ncbi:hypothetical protein [Acetobacter indonesiensis]|uniref:hypothetical protein n=1 Tax=Acetobacter indonesiensis TaxID=104101 RepID=UPI00130DD42C|nr:hypothetical protein [Acetobacter indonesiensis]